MKKWEYCWEADEEERSMFFAIPYKVGYER